MGVVVARRTDGLRERRLADVFGCESSRVRDSNSAAAGDGGRVRCDGASAEGAVSDCAGAGGAGDQLRAAYAADTAGAEHGVSDLPAASAVLVGVVDIVEGVSQQSGGDWAAGVWAGGVHGVGNGGVFGPVYHGAGLEGRISAGSGDLDYGCDCSDFDCAIDWAAAADRRHSGGGEPAE